MSLDRTVLGRAFRARSSDPRRPHPSPPRFAGEAHIPSPACGEQPCQGWGPLRLPAQSCDQRRVRLGGFGNDPMYQLFEREPRRLQRRLEARRVLCEPR